MGRVHSIPVIRPFLHQGGWPCSRGLSLDAVRSYLTRDRRPGRRKARGATSNRIRLRLDECERLELPGSILSVGSAFVDVSVVGQVSELSQLGQVGNLSYDNSAGDSATATGYNAAVAAADLKSWDQFFQQYAADVTGEARPAMNPVLLPEIEPADQPITPPADQPPLADPLELDEFADPFADGYLGLGVLAFGDSTSSLAPAGGAGWGVSGGGGAPFTSGSPTRWQMRDVTMLLWSILAYTGLTAVTYIIVPRLGSDPVFAPWHFAWIYHYITPPLATIALGGVQIAVTSKVCLWVLAAFLLVALVLGGVYNALSEALAAAV